MDVITKIGSLELFTLPNLTSLQANANMDGLVLVNSSQFRPKCGTKATHNLYAYAYAYGFV